MYDGFDIFRKALDGGIVWIESVKDLEAARERIKLLIAKKKGEYVIFCQATQEIVSEGSTVAPKKGA